MENLFALNKFQEFELWLDGLRAHLDHSGLIPGVERLDVAVNPYLHVQCSLSIMRDLTFLCEVLRTSELNQMQEADDSPDFPLRFPREQEERFYRCSGEAVASLRHFEESMRRFETILASFLRIPDLSSTEVHAAGRLIALHVNTLRGGETFQRFKRRFHNWKAYSTIHFSLLTSIDSDHGKRIMEEVLTEFFHLTGLLAYMQSATQQGCEPARQKVLWTRCYLVLRGLFTLLADSAKQLEISMPELAEALESTRSALLMEAGKVFKSELKELFDDDEIGTVSVKMERSLAMMENAVQGSLGYLTNLLSPKNGLFDNEARRFKEAILLLTGLETLYQLLQRSEAVLTEEGYAKVRKALENFQAQNMRLLFAADKEPFENLMHDLEAAEPGERAFVVHRLQLFISALISHVRNRTVFSRFGAATPAVPSVQIT